jgi:hypothetical protein
MKILIISESLWDLGPVYDMHIVSESLTKYFNEVLIIDPGYYGTFGFDKIVTGRALTNSNVHLIRPDLVNLNKSNFNTIICWVKRVILLYQVIKIHKPSIVITYSTSRFAIVNIFMPYLFQLPVIYRCIDVMHLLWESKFKSFIVLLLEKYTYLSCTKVYAMSSAYSLYVNRGIVKPRDVTVFNNSLYNFKDDNEVSFDYSENKIRIGFIGIFYKFCGLREFFYEINKKKELLNNIVFDIYGSGVEEEYLNNYINDNNLNKIIIMHGFIDTKDIPAAISSFNLGINTMIGSGLRKYIFNAKILQYLEKKKFVFSVSRPMLEIDLPSKETGIYYSENYPKLLSNIINYTYNKNSSYINQLGYDFVRKKNNYKNISLNMAHDLLKMTRIKFNVL